MLFFYFNFYSQEHISAMLGGALVWGGGSDWVAKKEKMNVAKRESAKHNMNMLNHSGEIQNLDISIIGNMKIIHARSIQKIESVLTLSCKRLASPLGLGWD